MGHCKTNKVSDEMITDINVKTLAYIKRCKRMKSSRNIQMTKKYLKDHDLLAVSFIKGIGIFVMKKRDYHSKMDKIIALPQFEKLEKHRKNAKHQVLPPVTPCYLLQHHATSCNTLLPPATTCYLLQHHAGSYNTILPPATPYGLL